MRIAPKPFEIDVLGPLRVVCEARVIGVPGRRKRAILSVLALRAGQPVSTDELMHAVWGDDHPPSGRKALQVHLSELRRLLREEDGDAIGDRLITVEGGYRLDIDPALTDVGRFVDELRRAAQPAEDAPKLEETLSLWRGDPMPDLPQDSSLAGEIERLHGLRRTAEERALAQRLATAADPSCVPAARVLVEAEPYREIRTVLLMAALYAVGRQVEALDAARATVELLAEELGLEAGPELRAAELAVLQHDPVALGLRPRADGPDADADEPGRAARHRPGTQDESIEVGRIVDAALVLADRASVAAVGRLAGVGGRQLLTLVDRAVSDGSATCPDGILVPRAGWTVASLSESAELHERAARMLAESPIADRGRHHRAVATHLVAALPLGDEGAAYDACMEAARHVDAAEPSMAAHWFRAAGSVAFDWPEAAPADRLDAALGEAEALVRFGGSDEDITRLTRFCIEQARELQDGRRLASAVLMAGQRRSVPMLDDDELVDDERRALELLGPEPSEARVRVLAQAAGALMMTDRDAERVGLANEGVALARQLGDAYTLAEALTGLHQADWRIDNAEERLALAQEAIRLADEGGSPVQQAHTRIYAVHDHLELGQWAEAEATLAGAEAAVARTGSARYRWATNAWRALFHFIQGRDDEAFAAQQHALAAWGAEVNADAIACHIAQTAMVQTLRGDPSAAVTTLTSVVGENPDLPVVRVVLARAALEAGDDETAARLLTAFDPDPTVSLPNDLSRQLALSMALEVGVELDPMPAWTGSVAGALEPFAAQHTVINMLGGGGFYWGVPARGLSRYAERLGDAEAAARFAAIAVAETGRIGAIGFELAEPA